MTYKKAWNHSLKLRCFAVIEKLCFKVRVGKWYFTLIWPSRIQIQVLNGSFLSKIATNELCDFVCILYTHLYKVFTNLKVFLFNFIVHTEQAGRSYKGQEKLKKKRLIKLSYRQALLKKEILKLDLKQKNIY